MVLPLPEPYPDWYNNRSHTSISAKRSGLCNLQGFNQEGSRQSFLTIDSLILPELLALVGKHSDITDMYWLLTSRVGYLLDLRAFARKT